jgi:hypothetical protein
MTILHKKKISSYFIHAFFWLLFCLGNWVMSGSKDSFLFFILYYSAALGFPILYFYIHISLLKKTKNIKKMKQLKIIFFSVIMIFITGFILELIVYLDSVVKKYFGFEIYVDPFTTFEYFLNVTVMGIIILGASFYFLIYIYRIQKKQISNLFSQQFKYQIQPHFFNNELQNLYAFIQNNNKEDGLNYVHNLADILNYNISASNTHSIDLLKEIQHLFNYLDLIADQWELHDKINYSLQATSTAELKIQPLILIYFVENSVKHSGLIHQVENAWLKLDISVQKNIFTLELSNSKPTNTRDIPFSTQVGLRNAKELLEIFYGKDHQLKIISKETIYTVQLHIKLP